MWNGSSSAIPDDRDLTNLRHGKNNVDDDKQTADSIVQLDETMRQNVQDEPMIAQDLQCERLASLRKLEIISV